ncbi:MAG: hypothetical protein H7325_05460 [Pedobacter sp.]|nr:hypothetical protein [Pedobacter sp.]
MKKNYLPVLLSILFCFSLQGLKAQKNADDSTAKTSYWVAGISYLSNSVYLGRKDSLRAPYITPIIGYYNKSGFYITGALSYLSTSTHSQIDLFELETGFTFTANNLDGSISAYKDFYNSKSYGVKSDTKGSLNCYLDYDLGFIKPNIQAEIAFSSKSDYSAALGLEHTFYAADDNIDITPSFLLFASTQNYYSSYYNKRKYSPRRKKANNPDVASITAVLPNAAKFKIMDYEFSVPVNYTVGNFTFNVTPTLALPTNPATVILTVKPLNGNTYTETNAEKLSNVFYWSVGVTFLLEK